MPMSVCHCVYPFVWPCVRNAFAYLFICLGAAIGCVGRRWQAMAMESTKTNQRKIYLFECWKWECRRRWSLETNGFLYYLFRPQKCEHILIVMFTLPLRLAFNFFLEHFVWFMFCCSLGDSWLVADNSRASACWQANYFGNEVSTKWCRLFE